MKLRLGTKEEIKKSAKLIGDSLERMLIENLVNIM